MNIIFGKIGGLIVTTKHREFCIFPANTWFAASKNVLVFCRIGFSTNTRAGE